MNLHLDALRSQFHSLIRSARAPRIRPIRQFAREEIFIPEGKHKGEKYNPATLPWQDLYFGEIDSGHWSRFVLRACVQGGKTLVGFDIPICWHLFEWRENVLSGVPMGEMAADKMRKELLPVISANPRWEKLLPQRGRGSRGGDSDVYTFGHGKELKFLTGHGGDEKRSGITDRVIAVTEADRVDTAGESSEEAAPIFQMEARLASFEFDARFYAECTTTTKQGFVYREWEAGSASKIYYPCPHGEHWVRLEREHLVGWDDAESELAAAERATFVCPRCGCVITDHERRQMCEAGKLVHRGQTIDDFGRIEGERPATRTLGFCATAFDNLLWSAGFIGLQEWLARRDRDQESAEKKMLQWYWSLPHEPDEFDVTPLTAEDVLGARFEQLGRGRVPPGTIHLSAGVDVRKRQIHYVVVAWYQTAGGIIRGHVVDLGIIPVDRKQHGLRRALREALRVVRDERLEAGYFDAAGKKWRPGWIFVDAGWQAPAVREFIRECRSLGIQRYLPSFGRGLSSSAQRNRYQQPTAESPQKPHVGEEYYIAWHDKHALHAAIVNVDHWKGFVHEGFATPAELAGALTTFDLVDELDEKLLGQFSQQVASERAVERLVPERGPVLVYVNDSRTPNHFLDAIAEACAAGHLCGVRIVDLPVQPVAPPPPPVPDDPTDDRPYFITDRED